ncbi:MAG: hypothetical protein WBN11_03285 [Eudoraea sp.]|uniref:hypothetical protein n=1 Tax=Eudoraea sp. TaxID=1979955 RepID=UPI003C77AE14
MKPPFVVQSLVFKTVLFCLIIFFFACSNDDLKDEIENGIVEAESLPELPEESETTPAEDPMPEAPVPDTGDNLPCSPDNQLILERDGLIVFEFENDSFKDQWAIENSLSDASGDGYVLWTGDQFLGSPGTGLVRYNLQIDNPGTYQFIWHSAVAIGNSGTDHNDTWLRFPDANDFYARKEASIVYPKGSGKSPNPEGGGADGWFKVYRSGNNLGFKWQASTYDNNAHEIFVNFDSPGIYTMEISARSSGHAIDKVMLYSTSFTQNSALENAQDLSAIGCKE